jgi:hypothetical protein
MSGGFCLGALQIGKCSPTVENIAKTFNKSLSENIRERLVSFSDTTGMRQNITQMIDLSNMRFLGCRVKFGTLRNKAVAKMDFMKMSQSVSESQFKTIMKDSLDKTIKNSTDVKQEFFGGQGGDTKNIMETYNDNVKRVVDKFSHNDFQSLMMEQHADQRISFAGSEVDCRDDPLPPGYYHLTGEELLNNIDLAMTAQKISKNLTKEFVKIMQENETKVAQTSDTKVTATGIRDVGRTVGDAGEGIGRGFGAFFQQLMWPIVIIICVIVLAIIIYVIVSRSGGSPAAQAQAEAVVGEWEDVLPGLIEVGDD